MTPKALAQNGNKYENQVDRLDGLSFTKYLLLVGKKLKIYCCQNRFDPFPM